jgi:hypothetical protein
VGEVDVDGALPASETSLGDEEEGIAIGIGRADDKLLLVCKGEVDEEPLPLPMVAVEIEADDDIISSTEMRVS